MSVEQEGNRDNRERPDQAEADGYQQGWNDQRRGDSYNYSNCYTFPHLAEELAYKKGYMAGWEAAAQ